MNKLIDLDKIFEKYIKKYIVENKGKFTEDEWESKVPMLYEKFGKTALPELDGKTPQNNYKGTSGKDLVDILKNSVINKVSVSDFLCETIIDSEDTEKPLFDLLDIESGEEIIMYAMNLLNDKKSTIPFARYIEFILDSEISTPVKELAVEILSENTELVKENILRVYENSEDAEKEYFVEILSRAENDDRIYNILIEAFSSHKNKIPLYAGYIARYNDERAVPVLLNEIERTDLKFEDFRELKYAIEKLGGEYDKIRDFSNDSSYKKVKFQSKK